jgi:hypothetical protein
MALTVKHIQLEVEVDSNAEPEQPRAGLGGASVSYSGWQY